MKAFSKLPDPTPPPKAAEAAAERWAPPGRRTYTPPRLTAYGRLSELTRFNGNDQFDGAIGTVQTG